MGTVLVSVCMCMEPRPVRVNHLGADSKELYMVTIGTGFPSHAGNQINYHTLILFLLFMTICF